MVLAQTQHLSSRAVERAPFPLVEVYASSELSEAARKDFRDECQNKALARAVNLRIITEPLEAIVHMIYPDDDLNAGGVTYNQWLTAALVAGTAQNFVNLAIAQNKVISIYGFFANDANPGIAQVRFARGAGLRNTLATYQLQRIYAKLETEGFFSKIDTWDRVETLGVELLPSVTDPTFQVFGLLGYTVEPVGEQVAGRIV